MPEAHDPYGALRLPDFCLLLIGSVLSGLGMEVLTVAAQHEIYQRTESALALGFVGLAQFLPMLLLTLPAGQMADRYSRKRQLALAQGLLASAALALAALSYLEAPVPLLYLVLVVVGIARAFSAPARWALLPQIVPSGLLNNAVTWNSSGWQLAMAAGPALGGAMLALTLPVVAYWATALCATTCAGLVLLTRPQPHQPAAAGLSLGSLFSGARFVWRTKPILATITLDLFAVLLGGASALLPIFAYAILDVDEVGFGLLRAAPPVGAMAMALVLAHRPLHRPGQAMLAAVAGFGLATVGFGLSESFLLSFFFLALTGALDNISVVVRATLVQVLTPDEMRGRVSAVNVIFIGSSNELGAFESGLTAWLWGPVVAVVVGGIGSVAVVGMVMALWPEVMRLGPLHKSHPPPLPEEKANDGLH